MSGNTVKQDIPKGVPKFAHQFIGNGNMFKFLIPYYQKYPAVQSINSVYNLAPASKWALSIVPLVGVVTGSQPVEKVNFNTSASLAITGFVWTVYALMITPQNFGSKMLASVNFAMGSVNGYNSYRRYQFDQKLNKSEEENAATKKQ